MDKYAFIMRGIPGSGKSTVARLLCQAFVNSGNPAGNFIVHSTDDLCMVDGEYQFDAALAGERHAQNLLNFKKSCADGVSCVIVDNTNVKTKQYMPYLQAAVERGYRVVFVELPHPAPMVAAQRNTHKVPLEVINQMVLDWEPSQHCITVEKVEQAARVVRMLQEQRVVHILSSFVLGTLLGVALCVVATWLVQF